MKDLSAKSVVLPEQRRAKTISAKKDEQNLAHKIMSSSEAIGIESYGLKRCKAICELRNVYVNVSDLVTARGNSLIFVYDQFPAERQIS